MASLSRRLGLGTAIAAAVLVSGLAVQSASAQGGRAYVPRAYYYQLPTVVRITPGMSRILRHRCDRNYPMHESMPCGTATGGPVGGLGS